VTAGRTVVVCDRDVLVAQALTFEVLGRACHQKPDAAWISALLDGDAFVEPPFAAGNPHMIMGTGLVSAWAAAQSAGPSAEAERLLAQDYTDLFVGAGTPLAAPWETVWLGKDHLVFEEGTMQVREWYRRFGLQAPRLDQEPDDHIGLEMAFLGHLALLAVRACDSREALLVHELVEAQRDFGDAHLLRWASAWCHAVQASATTPFYRGLACMVRGALEELDAVIAQAGRAT
jgi:putative dimethyl sulfoxide reductase chaperone